MNFIPQQPEVEAKDVPYFDDVTNEAGWQGHSTGKSMDTLKSEIISAISRLGGLVSGFQRGIFLINDKERDGFQIHYVVERPDDGAIFPGRIDIAALPVKRGHKLQRSLDKRRERALKMALYMLRMALNGTWFLQQLSPGYAPLMPWMLAKDDKTIAQLWNESGVMINLLPPAGTDFVEGEFEEQDK